MKIIDLKEVIFHITNVCNLSCLNCENYSDRNFKGHYFWKDHEDLYYKWAEKLKVRRITLIGGEPFANPKLLEWVEETRKCFKSTTEFMICTNGTYIEKNIDLTTQIIKNGFKLDISLHDPAFRKSIEDGMAKVADNLNATKVCASDEYVSYELNGRSIMTLVNQTMFWKNTTKEIKNKIIFFHRSDPVKAHSLCIAACGGQGYYLLKGKLYKCYFTAIGSDLTSQFNIEHEGAQLLNSYVPADPFDEEEKLNSFFEQLPNHIKQCTLCTETHSVAPIWPMPKGKTQL
jgi:organic radical activating enzyme